MNNDFPKMLYKFPGNTQLQDGNYDLLTVGNVDEHDAALVNGWFETISEAKIGLPKPIADWGVLVVPIEPKNSTKV